MADATSVGLVANQVVLSTVLAYCIEFLKKTKYFPWLTKEKAALSRGISVAASAFIAAGIHWTYVGAGGILTITGLTGASLVHGTWDWLRSFIFTQAAYDALINKDTVTPPPPDDGK